MPETRSFPACLCEVPHVDRSDGPDGTLSRRNFTPWVLARGGAFGGLSLAELLRLKAQAEPGARRDKSIIMLFLSGGPSHLDMYDMKPDAPREYRGPLNPIRTNVPGVEICELMPKQAEIADKFTILRGCRLSHLHSGNEFYSGYPWQESPRASIEGEAKRPALGSVLSRLRPGSSGMPPYVSLNNVPDWERAYYLGLEFEPFSLDPSSGKEQLENMGRHRDMTSDRLASRGDLLHAIDLLRRDLDNKGMAKGLDAFQTRALEIVSSPKVRDAFDVEKESESMRERYGGKRFREGNNPGKMLLQARRLVEAGVSVVTACSRGWDTHANNFPAMRDLLPPLDQALHALVTDLDERGMLQDVMIVMGGEFGRSPRIGDLTPDGRNHWPEAGFLWVAGGGLKTGQVIGATDARGEKVIGTPIVSQNLFATLYPQLGIDPSLTFRDHNGRPQYILENRQPIPGLV
ncbi:MAG: DUF1501 domain-containing protein [Planctomycetales bacterium]